MSASCEKASVRSKLRGVLKTSFIVFFFLITAKLLNFLKKILVGQLFGVSDVADAFFAASYLPYYLAIFFEGVIFLGFLPLFAQAMTEKGKKEAGRFVCSILTFILAVTGILALAGWWAAPWIIRELVPGFGIEARTLTSSLFQVLSLVIIFISLSSFFKALNSYFEHYAYAASSGLVDTLVMIGVTLASWRVWGVYGAAWGAVLGAFFAFATQGIFLLRKKHLAFPDSLRPDFVWLKKLLYFLVPMGLIWAFQQIPYVILNRFGSGMWQGTISALTISLTLTTVPMGLVSHTVLFAIFPSLARQATEMTPENVRTTFFRTLRGGFLVLVPIGFLLTGLAWPLSVIFFSGGGISEEGTRRIANALACFGWATFALYADLFMTQSLIAVRKTRPAIFLCVTRAVLTYGIGYFLSSLWDYRGLALSFSAALVVNLFVLFPVFFRMSPFRGGWGSLFRHTGKLLLASSPILLMTWFFQQGFYGTWLALSPLKLWSLLLGGFLGGAGLFLFLLFRLKVGEVRTILEEIRKSWGRKRWWLAEQTE